MAAPALAEVLLPLSEATRRPWLTTSCLVITDSMALSAAVLISVCVKALVVGNMDWTAYFRLGPLLLVFLVVYKAIGLYTIVALSPPEELRRSTVASSVLFVVLATATMTFRGARHEITWTLLMSIAISVVLQPLMRAFLRRHYAAKSWWGYSAVVFGAKAGGKQLLDAMLKDPSIGLKPVALVDEWAGSKCIRGVPVYRRLEDVPDLARPAYAVFAAADLATSSMQRLIERHSHSFSHVLVMPDFQGLSSFWVQSRNLAGMVGLEIAHSDGHLRYKRILDCFLALVASIFIAPIVALLTVLIMVDSPGPVFYGQRRIGRHGRMFKAWKFRSMVTNGDEILERHLRENPQAAIEWQATQKLRVDPRVTRLGRLLRRTSMDELPQIWNVIAGQMSFVGPRPIVEGEVVHYGADFELYKQVHSGITGLWQVSGRSDTSYAERVSLDTIYALNWSVWLDLCILVRTIPVVLFGKGAY